MDLYVAPSLQSALRDPQFFQLTPLLLRVDQSIPASEVASQFANQFKIRLGSDIPSMNMFSVILPQALIEDVMATDAITEMHLDHQQYAFGAGPPMLPFALPPFPIPGMGPSAVPGLPLGMADVFTDPQIKLTEEGWIPTADVVKATNVPALWEKGLKGAGVNVAVLDTGCDNQNPQLQGTVKKRSTMAAFPTGDDLNGHGTWCITCVKGRAMRHPVSGLPVAGVAPDCDMTSWKVLGYGIGTGSTSDIMAAIDKSVAENNVIISMSLGSSGRDDEEQDPMVRQINMYAEQRPEVLIVVANGNSGPDPKTVGVPAAAEGAISVGSWGLIDDFPAYFSSRGPTLQAERIKPDIAAPGGGRRESALRPKETLFSGTAFGSMLDGYTDKMTDAFTSIAGTSMATPHVAGVLAQWKQYRPDLTGADVKMIFAEMGGQQQNNESGFGFIDATWIFNY